MDTKCIRQICNPESEGRGVFQWQTSEDKGSTFVECTIVVVIKSKECLAVL